MIPLKSYYRLMLGPGGTHAQDCLAGGFVGVDFKLAQDLTPLLGDSIRGFNQHLIPLFLQAHPEKSKVAAGLAGGAIWNVCRGMKTGDILLCPNGEGLYLIAEVTSDYSYHPQQVLPHRRQVKWFDSAIQREAMSEELKNSSGAINTLTNLTRYAEEIEGHLRQVHQHPPLSQPPLPGVEDPVSFALEKHLEDFLVRNWSQTLLGQHYDIFEEDGETGQQFMTDTGPMDLLAVSKDKKELLVVELKRGRASDAVVGQIQRYMGYVQAELCEPHQTVRGVIIALDDDLRLQRALSVAPNIDFYRYQIHFELLSSKRGKI